MFFKRMIKLVSTIVVLLALPATGARHYMTWYDKSESGPIGLHDNRLVPFVSAAVPRELWKSHYKFGDTIFVSAMKGRKMPGGKRHTGYLQLADECRGSKCFQRGRPVIDIYVGTCKGYLPDFTSTVVTRVSAAHRLKTADYGCR